MEELSFGNYVRQRRRELDLTQEELARRVGCAAITIRKIEAEDARPSIQIAERLAMALAIPLDQRAEFVRRARAVRTEPAELPTPPPKLEEIGLEDLTGRAIRGYALNEKIGSGGMGAVYRAVQPIVEREVAVKIILPAFANHPDFIRRFEAEAQMVARLEHPHIVPLYDYWREPGVAYLVMRLLRGGSLQKLLQTGALPVDLVCRLLEQITSALGAAHRIGIIHRDLKPANILLDEDQNAYLVDFGIAKNLSNPEANENTEPGAMIGSPQYISPEQIRSLSVGPQTDIYGLGLMLYELLTGKAPFLGPTPFDLIQQHMYEPMPQLAAHSSGLPAELDVVIARATAKDSSERYPDAAALLADFRKAVSGMTTKPVFVLDEQDSSEGELVNPYKGLRAFGEADVGDFFGRETLVQQLLARLSEGGELARFLAVIGPSGSGKSSVVRAGLLPALRRGGLLGSENWFYVDFLPGQHPFEELEAALLRVAVNPPPSLLEQLKDGDRGLLRAVNRILPSDPAVELLLVIDQFEELFTLLDNEQERALFLNNLVTACMDERSRVRIVITLRADFIDRPLRFVDFGELLQRRNELVLPLTPDELERAILAPARRAGLKLEAGLAAAIIRDLGEQPGSLPLMQYALTELFERRQGNLLTRASYQAIGGVLGALGSRGEEVFKSLGTEGQETARQMFLRLVTLGEGTEDTRRRVLRAELEGLNHGTNQLAQVIETFGKARLLSMDHDPATRSPTVEVAHEALIREWPRLKDWLFNSRNDIRMQRLLCAETSEWLKNSRDSSYLLTGAHLAQFAGWAENSPVALTQDEQAFLDASLDEQKHQQARETERQRLELESAQKLAETEKQRAEEQTRATHRIRMGARLLAGALLVTVALGIIAVFQRQEALRQASIGLASQATMELQGASPERSVLLALEALENFPYTWQAEQALANTVHEFRLRYIMIGHLATVMDIAWSHDGNKFATTGADGRLALWDAQTRQELLNIPAHLVPVTGISPGAWELAWSPDGACIATAGLDKTAKVWDVATGKEITVFTGHSDEVLGISWSPDGLFLASASKDGTIKVWDAQTGKENFSLQNDSRAANSVAWSPDGSKIAAAGELGMARVWDAISGAEQINFSGHTETIWSVAWSPDGKQIATASDDGTVRVWDPNTGQELSDLRLASPVWEAAWSPDGKQIATTSADGIAQVWDLASGTKAFVLQGRTLQPFHIAWSPDEKWLGTTAGADYSVRIWDATPATLTLSGAQKVVTWVAWSPDGKRIAISYVDKTAVVWDSETGKALVTFRGHTDMLQDVFWSPDGTQIVTTDWDNIAKVWDANTGQELVTFLGHVGEPISRLQGTEGMSGSGWSPDGSRIMTQGGDGSVRIWDAHTWKEILVFQATKDIGANANWSPDGTRIASCAIPGVLQMWDASTGKPIFGGYIHNTANLFFGDLLDYCFDGGWSPDGKKFLTGSWNGNGATIWDTKTGEKILVFTGITDGGIGFSSWSPNGQRIASGNSDTGEVKIWDAETGAVVFSFQMPIADYLFQLDWSPDGKHLIGSAMMDSVPIYRVWQTTGDLIAYAKECCVARELTAEERQQFGLP